MAATITMCVQLIANKPSTINFSRKPVIKSSRVISSNSNNRAANAHCSLQLINHSSTIKRRSGNYNPSLWDSEFIQSLDSGYLGESHMRRFSELKLQVKKILLEEDASILNRLELADDLQRLGISYHFEDEIKKILTSIYEQKYHPHDFKNNNATIHNDELKEKDLCSTALEFRLLRQHGFGVSQDMFDCFKNEKGEFKSSLENDTKGLLQLYEASHLVMEGETTLELAREFSTKFLKQIMVNSTINSTHDDEKYYLYLLVCNALEMPIHWRAPRPNSRWFIEAYEKRADDEKNSVVLELAKLDFNIVQAKHQEELKEVSRWWKETCIAETLPFARDRVVENYFWTIGMFFEPRHVYARLMCARVIALVTIIDDVYDVYGTLEELELFTDVIQRWDIGAINQLPHYMKLCFLALNNFVDEMAYDVLKEQGVLVIPYLRKSWIDLVTKYLQEAKWYSEGYSPRLDEYIDHGLISSSGLAVLTHAFFQLKDPVNMEVIESLYKYPDVVRCSSLLLRLGNDLGTSPHEMKRGDVPKAIQCCINEIGVSETEAREHIKYLVYQTWKKMNGEQFGGRGSPFSKAFIDSCVGLGQATQYMYQHGDGHGVQNRHIKEGISSLLFEPIA